MPTKYAAGTSNYLRYCIQLVLLFTLVGCASINTDTRVSTTDNEHSTLLIYRDKKLVYAGLTLYVANDKGYFTSLQNGEYAEIPIDAGEHNLIAKGRTGDPSPVMTLSLSPNKTVCLLGKPNVAAALTGGFVPLVGLLAPKFMLEQTSCPNIELLENLVKIDA